MSFVASCHHLVAQCFRLHGNAKHGPDDKVSLEEVQAAIREEFLDASGRLPLQGRGSFLESVQESPLASQAGPCGQLAAANVATELTENVRHPLSTWETGDREALAPSSSLRPRMRQPKADGHRINGLERKGQPQFCRLNPVKGVVVHDHSHLWGLASPGLVTPSVLQEGPHAAIAEYNAEASTPSGGNKRGEPLRFVLASHVALDQVLHPFACMRSVLELRCDLVVRVAEAQVSDGAPLPCPSRRFAGTLRRVQLSAPDAQRLHQIAQQLSVNWVRPQ